MSAGACCQFLTTVIWNIHKCCVVDQNSAAFVVASSRVCHLRYAFTEARFPFKRKQRTQRKHLLCVRKRKTQALALATMIGCFDRAFLLAGACVRCVKNRISSIGAFSYAMTAYVSCVTCACVLLFFACVIFLRLLRFLCTFYFACVLFLFLAFEWKPGLRLQHVQALMFKAYN